MKILNGYSKIIKENTVITIGNFDGIHKGHQKILKNIVKISKKNNLKSVVITFKPHPNEYFKKNYKPFKLTNEKTKIEEIRKLGIDYLILINFNKSLNLLSPENFVKKIINFKPKFIVVGYNFHFGYKRQGDISLLKKLSKKYLYNLKVINPVIGKSKKIFNSTYIRKQLELGKYDESIRNYDMILDINPKNVKALASKSIALSKLERYSESLISIDTAVMLEPDNEIVQNKKMNFLAGVPTIPAHDSIYDINFRITLRDSSGNFIGVAEATNTRYLPYDITDTALETEFSTKERVIIDGIMYDRVQKTEKYVNKNTEMNGMWSFTVRDQGFIIDVFQAFTPYVTLEDGDNIVAEWIILKQIS